MSSSNAIPVGDTITDGVSIVYVSSNGDDANSGLNSAEPKLTIAAALITAYGFTSLGRRVVKCIDASVFTENVGVSQVVDIEMPHARINGTLGATSNLGRMSFDVAIVQGNVTVRAFSHYTFEQVRGDLIIENCTLGDSYVHAEDWVAGSVVTTNAAGVVTFNIVHNDANLDIPTDISGFTPKGLVDGEPVNSSEYARSLETLTGDLRLQSSAVHYPDGSQIVYVSANGSNSSSGLSVHEAVQTLNQAMSVAASLPTTARRIIACFDGSHFAENFSSANNIDLYLPTATVTGNISGSTGDKTFIRIGTLKGNLVMGTQDTVEIDELQGDISYQSGSHASYLKIHHFLSGSASFDSSATGYCHIQIDMPRNATVGAWPSGMYIFGHIGENTYTNGVSLVSELTKLTGADRLDASAIKNLPSGSSQHAYAEFTDMGTGGNGWYDLITWSAVTEIDTSGADFILFMKANNTDVILTYRININTPRGISEDTENTMMRIIGSLESASLSGASFRIIRDTASDVNSGIRLQIELDVGNTYTGLMSSLIPLPYPAGSNFGGVAKYTSTGNEKVIKSISTNTWKERNIVDGTSGGIACTSVGEHDYVSRAWIDFSTGDVNIHAEDQIVQQVSSHGTRFSAGEYGTWGTDSPEPAFPTNVLSSVTNNKRSTNDDITGNPLSTVICNLSNASTGSALLRWDSIDGKAIIRLVGNSSTNRGCMRHRFDGVTIGQKIRVTQKWWHSISSTMDHEVRHDGPEGPLLKALTLPSTNPVNNFYTVDFEYTVTLEDAYKGYADLFLVNTSSGSTGYYLYSYRVDIIVDQPALQTNVVGQFDSVYRGLLFPRIVPVSSDEHTRGIVALDATGFLNPIFFNGDNWSNFALIRNDTADVEYGTYYSSELGTGLLVDQGFEQTTGPTAPVVQNYNGFPQLLRLNHNGTISIFSTIDDTDAFWQAAWDRGLLVTHRVIAADTSRDLHMNIEPRNSGTSWGTGRFTYNITNNSSGDAVLQLERANGGSSNFEVPISKNVMHTISVFVSPTSSVATVLLDGQVVGTAGLGGYDGQRGICTFTVGGAAGDYYLQQYGITIMKTTATAKNFTVKEITDSIRYVIPTTANNFVMTMPKTLMPVGTTFTVVNGGSREVTIKGADDDLQLFGGNVVGRIPTGSECTLVQSGFPTGCIWTMSNSTVRRTPESQGKQVSFNVNGSSLTAHAKHGTYSGDINITRATGALAGAYIITPSNLEGHVFSISNTYISAQLVGAPVDYEIKVEFASGFPEIRCYNASNALVDHDFSVSLAW